MRQRPRTRTQVGFPEDLQTRPVGALSGGWKMKLALSRAILQKADILLLDEPTNHLDVVNVKWLMDYLMAMTSISSMIVSHDSNFLETVCTHIIHYENRKLKSYRGNLTEFVKQARPASCLCLCVLAACCFTDCGALAVYVPQTIERRCSPRYAAGALVLLRAAARNTPSSRGRARALAARAHTLSPRRLASRCKHCARMRAGARGGELLQP